MAEIKSYPNNVNVEIGAENVMRWHHGRTSGVFGAPGELAVAALTTPGMAVTVSDGDGWLADRNGNGIHFWNDVFASTAALLQLAIDTADGVLNRIDRVVVEWSTPNYTQLPEIKVLKGTSAVTPVAPALTNNASLRQISLARISVAAGTLAITAGMITDERFDATVCGIVTENLLVDTTVAVAQLNEVISQAQALIDALTAEAVPNHANTHAADGDDPVSPASIGAELVSLRFSSTVVAPASFSADTTYADYPFRAAVALTGVTANHDVDVRLDAPDAASGLFAPVATSYNGGVYLYASEVPEASVTIPRIICSK
ncbi:MAG: hypothetical protein VB034_14110 [Eubacteriales bacterium]|nr:hypothetical protein [Eubacteriales bacterium]